MSKVIGILAGSLRKESFSKKVGKTLLDFAPDGFEFKLIDLSDIPLYNQDFDDHNEVPEAITKFRTEIANVDGVIFVTPEYNRSVPAVLKNAIDVGSRPYGKSVWDKKPAAIFSNSPGNLSAFGANHHLRQSLVFLNMPTMQQPEVYIAHVNDLFDEEGNMKEGGTKDFIKKAVESYIVWFNKNAE
ncbi:NADPH-dependent FMN reductase [Chryseobacterium formosense]|uniref:NADPH-dependent FMN reductase n=1 Tax=Chryseobacterium formosense TaxID=236814 RepID=A0A085Z873_9FLAO|nr:NAD(P)H-dependent oxidoreductase [Chryseobacterium formosense]KFF00637.1 NADPH-dependent FMN reductase [Chryseobacterium formosense]SFT35959.1 chromate reductase [Chryseobacterium formosense]